jgi:hypothetical protein
MLQKCPSGFAKFFNFFFIFSFFCLFVLGVCELFKADFPTYQIVLCLFIGSVIGAGIADFFTGMAHWFGDSYGNPDWPVLGKYFIFPFREHHVLPKKFTEHDFFEVNGTSCLIPSFVLGLSFFVFPQPETSLSAFFVRSVILAGSILAACTNQFHKWAHLGSPPSFVKLLQKYRLILAPENHDFHHTEPFRSYYCITGGWVNPLLHKIHFWSFLEKIIFKLFHVKAANYDLKDYVQLEKEELKNER